MTRVGEGVGATEGGGACCGRNWLRRGGWRGGDMGVWGGGEKEKRKTSPTAPGSRETGPRGGGKCGGGGGGGRKRGGGGGAREVGGGGRGAQTGGGGGGWAGAAGGVVLRRV